MRLKPVEQQVVVVFGASRGIGKATAQRFAERGARVVVAARSEDGLESLVEEIRQAGGEALAVPAEAADYGQVQAVADAAARAFGHIDTWVQVAAVSVYSPFSEMSREEFKRVIDVNLNGAAYGAMAALPYLRRAGGGAADLHLVCRSRSRHAVPQRLRCHQAGGEWHGRCHTA